MRRSRRALLGLVVVSLGALDVAGLLLELRAHNRLRDRSIRGARQRVLEGWPRVAAAMGSPSPEAGARVARYAVASGLASEAEVLDPDGTIRFSYPSAAPVEHLPTAEEIDHVIAGSVLTFGPVQPASRVVSYVSLAVAPRQRVLMRLSTEVPDLVQDLRERRLQVIRHGATLMILVVGAGLLAAPVRSGDAESVPPSALLAYEEAMGRLRDRGHDLEERVQDKEALARAGELTAGMVHEVRNGLGTILGYARLLEREGAPSEALDASRSIREECETLEGVVRRFMDYVKRETLNPSLFDARRMMSRVVSRQGKDGRSAEVRIAVAEPGTLWGDEELVERAFENLVRNAREAAGPAGHVRTDVTYEDGAAVVTVADDGPGMAPELLERLRPFFTTKPGGLGLGLALSLKIVRLHDGSLTFSAGSPRGLVATMRLPLPREQAGS